MKKIVWVTGDYFIDVDFLLVPYLQKTLDISWYVVRGHNSNITVDSDLNCKVVNLKNKSKDPRILAEYKSLFSEIKKLQPDLIYSDYVGVPYYYPLLLNVIRNIPIVHAAHNVIPYPVWSMSLKLYVRYVFWKNNHFQLFSKFTAEYFKKHYPKKSMLYAPMVVKNYGDVSTDNYNVDRSKLNLLFFGNVVANKRLDLLIDAVKGLPDDVRAKVHLNICGKCNDKDNYIQQIDGCESIFTYFKRIDDCDIAELFTKHDFLMLPYQDVAQSGPHMIAYNYNLPVIASDIDGFKERVIDGENGFLFKRNDIDNLREVIIKAVEMSESDYNRMKENLMRYTADNFAVESVAKKYLEYFKSIAK